jgi:hypothetical protein
MPTARLPATVISINVSPSTISIGCVPGSKSSRKPIDRRARRAAPKLVNLSAYPVGAKRMSRVIKMSTPKRKPVGLPKTAALTKAQAEHKAWLKKHGIKVTKNTLRT